jgi:multidrug efflux pump subunit AcrA (membrane-fusion protein)
VAAGEYVGLNNKIATIVRMGSLKLQLQTPEQRASRAKIGMPVVARVSAYPDPRIQRQGDGHRCLGGPHIAGLHRGGALRQRNSELRPGMFAKARVLLPGGETAVFVPRNAILRDKTTDSNQVFVIENGKARLRVVVVGDADGGQVRIASGLTGNETVAVSRLSELYDGATVGSHN